MFSSGTLCVDISDHFPVFQLTLVEGKNKKQFPDKFTYRKFNRKNITSLKKLTAALSWENVFTHTDVNCAYKAFIEPFNSIFYQSFPLITAKKAGKHDLSKLWFTSAIQKSSL